MKRISILFIALAVCLFSCDDDDTLTPEEQLAKDISLIEDYLEENNLEAQSTESGLHYIIDETGNSEHPILQSIVQVKYTGKLLNGNIFDSGEVDYNLSAFILGWQEGIPLFGVGGKGKLFIPSALGYGSMSRSSIPANSVLIFDVELVSFQ